jgi:hypothetical protein
MGSLNLRWLLREGRYSCVGRPTCAHTIRRQLSNWYGVANNEMEYFVWHEVCMQFRMPNGRARVAWFTARRGWGSCGRLQVVQN